MRVYAGSNPYYAKAHGLGDIEPNLTIAPIEIGNRVWEDKDKDGVQDANETGIAGATVNLYAANGTTLVGSATTDANGNYFFTSATGTSTASKIYGLSLAYNTNYVLSFPTTISGKILTTKNLGANDLIDSDAATDGKITITTGFAAENNHTYDVGYICVAPTATATATNATCTGSTANSDAKITVASFTTGQRYQYTTGTTFSGTATPSTITVIPAGGIITSSLPNTTSSYTVRIYDATDDLCYIDRTVNITTISCCTAPTANTPTTTLGTCTGSALNNDASISITGATGDKASISTANAASFDGAAYASATSVSAGSLTFSNLGHGKTYIIRLYSNADSCFKDITFSTNTKTCCPSPNCGTVTVIKQ